MAVDARGLLADMQRLQAEARARRCVCLLGSEVASHLTKEQTHPAATRGQITLQRTGGLHVTLDLAEVAHQINRGRVALIMREEGMRLSSQLG